MSVGQSSGIRQQSGNQQGAQQGGAQPADWDALKGDVADIASAAVEQGRTLLESTRDQATTYVDRRKDEAAQSVADFASTLRESGKGLDDSPNVQAIIESAAGGLDQLAETIRSRTFADVYNELEVVMRRRPAAFAAATAVAGFVLARFIKSSAEGLRDYEQQNRAAMRYNQRSGRQTGRSAPQMRV